MKIKQLDSSELKAIYENQMQRDFPPSELKPYNCLKSLMDSGEYLPFGCYENNRLTAYALFVISGGAALLDYYAVEEDLRGCGVGGTFLSEIQKFGTEFGVPHILIEVESLETAENPKDLAVRERRIRFYDHCGCRKTQIYSHLFGVEYQILYLPLSEELPADETVRSELEQIYRILIAPLVPEKEEYCRVCQVFSGYPTKK